MTASICHTKRRIQQHEQRYDAAPEKVFPLLCPVREKQWLEVWDCEMIWSRSGVAEKGCIFTTNFPATGKEVWVVDRYEPGRAIGFVRTSAHRVTLLTITLRPLDGGGTAGQWTYTHTGLDPEGDRYIEKLSDESYEKDMCLLEKLINHYLSTGQMLKNAAGHYRQETAPHANHQPGSQKG